MSIRTVEQLSDALSDDIVWRKKELSSIKLTLENRTLSSNRQPALLRGAVPLLYAHWEGFIKNASRYYLEFIHYQRLPFADLTKNFIVLGARSLLQQATQSNKIKFHLGLADFFINDLNKRSRIPYKDGISTRSNLSSDVLYEIISSLGLDYTPYETKAVLIDELLLSRRNTIAHGEYLSLTMDSYLEIHEQVLEMMEVFRNQIDNSAVLGYYKAA